MKSNIPWSVKGIDPEAREAAKVAARRAGMTLGEWLNSLILQSGELPPGFAQSIGPLTDDDDEDLEEDSLAEASDAADELQDRIENLNRTLDQADRAALAGGIDESIERLASTLESSRRLLATGEQTQKSMADLAHRVEWIQSRLEEVASQHRSGIDSKTLIALERAIAGVASHIEKSDRRNTELVQTVEGALSELGSRVDGADSKATEAAGRMDIAIDRLTTRVDSAQSTASEAVGRIDLTLDRLGTRIETSEAEQRRSAARLNERLSQVDDRIAHSGVEREQTLATIERRLAGFETKLQTVQTRVETAAVARPNMPPDAMTRLEFEDWSRRQSIDLNADTSSIKRSVATIEARLSGVMERIDRARNETEGQIKDVERKAEDALRLGQGQTKAADNQAVLAIGDLRSSVDEIAQKFDRTNHTTTETMSALEGVLRSLTRRLDVLEGRGRGAEPAAAPAAPAAPKLEPEPDTTDTALPKRPTWSWGVPQQGRPTSEPQSEIVVESEEIAVEETAEVGRPAYAAARVTADDRVTGGTSADDAFELYDDADDAAGTTHTEDGAVEMTFEPDRRDPSQPSDEEAALAGGQRKLDLSNLVFNLDGARETPSEERERRPGRWRATDERVEPTIDAEPVEDALEPGSSAWLEQARRAAQAAGPSDRASDFAYEDEGNNSKRAFIILAIVVLALAAFAAAGAIFVKPWLDKSGFFGGSSKTTTVTSTVSGEPPAPVAPTAGLSPLDAPPGAPPSENDIGPPLPADTFEAPVETPSPSTAEPATTDEQTPAATAESDATQTEPASVVTAEAELPEQTAPAAEQSAPPVSAEDAMQAAAARGEPRALYALALAYKNGRGVAANPAQALATMKQAADKNLAVAQRALGIWYENGDGVTKDTTQARIWYEKAANNGDPQSMHNLAYFYAKPDGGLPRDGEAAQRWFKAAAERGLVASQVNLAIIQNQGQSYGLPTQNDQAYLWSSIAARRDPNDADAAKIRDGLAGTLPPEVKAEMDQAAQRFKAKVSDIVAVGGFDISPEAFLPPEQRPALSRAELTTVQELLNEQGYNAGTADGRPGTQTETAIKEFQATYKLPQTGVANRDLLAALQAVPR